MPKLSTYTTNTTPALTDKLLLIDDPAGTPATQLIALSTAFDFFNQQRLKYLCNNVQTLDSSTAETTILNNTADVGSLVFAAAYFTANKTVRFTAFGTLSCIGVPGNITIKAKFGSTVIASTGTVALQASQSAVGWKLDLLIGCASAGASGQFIIEGEFVYGAGFRLPMANANAVTIDTTASQTFNLTGQFSVNDAGNIISNMLNTIEVVY